MTTITFIFPFAFHPLKSSYGKITNKTGKKDWKMHLLGFFLLCGHILFFWNLYDFYWSFLLQWKTSFWEMDCVINHYCTPFNSEVIQRWKINEPTEFFFIRVFRVFHASCLSLHKGRIIIINPRWLITLKLSLFIILSTHQRFKECFQTYLKDRLNSIWINLIFSDSNAIRNICL